MMIGCSLPRHYRLLAGFAFLLLLSSCGGEAEVAIETPGKPDVGRAVSGVVSLPRTDQASAPSVLQRIASAFVGRVQALMGSTVTEVGRNYVVQLVRVTASNVTGGEIPAGLTPLAEAFTGDDGVYQLELPAGMDENTCLLMLQVGESSTGSLIPLTRAFVYRTQGGPVDIDLNSEAAVRLIAETVGEGKLCDYSAKDIERVVDAIRAAETIVDCPTIENCNTNATTAARADAGVQAALLAGSGPAAVLASDIDARVTTIPLVDASGFPTSGMVEIDGELISYTGKDGNSLTGALRGAQGSNLSVHTQGALVNYLVATPPTPTRTFSPTPTNTPTRPTPTNTPSRTGTTTPTPSVTNTRTVTATSTSTNTFTPTSTPTSTNTPTSTPIGTATSTSTSTPTLTHTSTPTSTHTFTPIITDTPTQTPTQTGTPTNSFTATPSQTPTDTRTNTPTETPTLPPSLDIGQASGPSGSEVLIPVTLTSNGHILSAVSNDIGFDSALAEPVLAGGQPDCQVAGAIAGSKQVAARVLTLAGTSKRLRVGVFGLNQTQLPDGVTYTCRFVISANAPSGAIALGNTPDASDPNGNAALIVGTDGSIVASGAPPAVGLGTGQAAPGGQVILAGAFTAHGQSLSALASDITFDPNLLSVVLDGQQEPECVVAAAIGGGTPSDKQVFARVLGPGQDGKQTLRVGVIGTGNRQVLPDGSVFQCSFTISSSATPNTTIPLGNHSDGSTPDGNPIGMQGADGTITVL